MPLIVGKRKSPEKGLKLRIHVACCWTDTVRIPLPAGGNGVDALGAVAVASVPASVAVASAGAAVVAVGAAIIAVAVGEPEVPASQAERTRERTISIGSSKPARRLLRFTLMNIVLLFFFGFIGLLHTLWQRLADGAASCRVRCWAASPLCWGR